MSRGLDVDGILKRAFDDCVANGFYEDAQELHQARFGIAEVFAAAHASLAARDLADQIAADDRLRAALAACEPETPHEPV
ncbi:hypothetical protein ACSYS7_001749 [Stenotrophomonas maltophilia]